MTTFTIAQAPPVTYELWVTESFCVYCTGKVPSRVHRWVMHVVFGFRFVIRQGEPA